MVKELNTVKKLSKEEFAIELAEIKKNLPNNYGVLLKHLFPETNIRTVYNVVNYGVRDEEILKMLKSLTCPQN